MSVLETRNERVQEANRQDDEIDLLIAAHTEQLRQFFFDLNSDIARQYIFNGQIQPTLGHMDILSQRLSDVYLTVSSEFSDKLRLSPGFDIHIDDALESSIDGLISRHTEERSTSQSTIILASYMSKVQLEYDSATSKLIQQSTTPQTLSPTGGTSTPETGGTTSVINVNNQSVAEIATSELNKIVDDRVETILETEIGESSEFDKWAESSVIVAAGVASSISKQWTTMRDDLVRPTHVEADGQIQPVDKPFIIGSGTQMYKGDPRNSPIKDWINCRCLIIYFIP